MKKRDKHYFGRLLVAVLFACSFWTARAQTFTFECVTEYLTPPDCDICNAQVQSRYFNGLLVRRNGVATYFLDCPILIKQQGGNLVFQELIYPNPQTVTISVLGTSYADINEFRDSVLCCVAIDTTGGGGDPSVTNEGVLGVAAGGSNDALLTSNTSGAAGVTVSGSNTITVTETTSSNGGTITLQADTSLLATLNDIRGNTFDTVTDYTALRLYDKPQKLVYVSQDNLEGFFERVASGTDDNGTIIDGVFTWQRVYDRSRLNVKWFGAVGDSATDDGAAIQAAFDIALQRKNVAVYFPAGKYRTTQTLEMYRPFNVSIYGAGMDNTFIFPVNVTGFDIATDSLDFLVFGKYGVIEARNMTIKDLAVMRVGSLTYDTPAYGMWLKGGFETVIENVRIEEFYATGGAAAGKGIGLKLDRSLVAASPEYAAEAVQHRTLNNVYISECDTGLTVRTHNTLYFYNLRLDLNWKVGLSLNNNVIWENGMCQGSGKAGIYIQNALVTNQYRGVYLRGIHFENNAWDSGYGAIYKPSTVPLTNFEVTRCLFSAASSDTVAYLRAVRDGFWGNNINLLGSTDTLYLIDCGNFDFGQDNYYAFGQVTTGSKIRFLNGSPGVSDEAYNGLTLNRDAAGSYALNVGGSGIFEGNVGIGIDAESGVPAQDFHVEGTARITGNSGTSTTIMGRDGDGDVSAVTAGAGLSLSGNVLSSTLPVSSFSTTVTLPTVVGNTREIGVMTHNEGGRAALATIDIIADVSGLGNVRRYAIPLQFNSTGGVWVKLMPIVSNGAEGSEDFELEMKTNTSGSPSGGIDTLRVVRTSGSTAGSAKVVIQFHGSDIDGNTFTATSNTSTSAITATYPQQSIAQVANKVGVNTFAPSRELDVNGEARVRDLTTTTATQLTGADANGVLSGVTLATGLTLPSGVLTPADNSATNELQTLSNTSDATSHTVTLSSSGGSVQLIEGANVTLTTGGTALNGTVTIASTASGGTNYQTWRDDGTPVTQQPNANFVSNSDIAFTLTNDGANSETEVTADIPANAVDNSEFRQSAGLSVVGRAANSTGNVADITGTVQTSPQVRGTALGFHPIPTKTFFSTVTMPTTVGNTTEIGVMTHNEAGRGAMSEICVNFAASGAVTSKRYFIPLVFNSTGGSWVKLLPISSAGAWEGAQDFEVEMKTNTSGSPSGGIDTIRVVRTAGTVAGTADVVVQFYGSDVDGNTFTATSNTSTSAITATYSRQAIAQVANKVGVNTYSPQRDLHVVGEVRITDLDTDPATRIVGADADGDLDAVILSDELAITSGTLGTNFSTTISPATLTAGMTNNWNPTGLATAWIIRVSGDDEFQLVTGITAPSFNKRLTVHNVGLNAMLFPHENQSSTAANRFNFGRDIVLFGGKSIEIQYDVTSSRWRLLSKAGIYDDVENQYFNTTFQSPVSLVTAEHDFWEITSAAAATAVPPSDGLLRGVAVNTSTSSSGGGYVASKEQFVSLNTAGAVATWGYVKAKIVTPSSLSDGTNNYALRIGFLEEPLQSDIAEGAYFYYNHSINSGAWSCYTQNAGSSQNNNSGVTVAASSVYVLEVVYRPNLSVEFFVNGTRVATNDSQIPSSDTMKVIAEIEKQGGTSQRDLQVFLLQTSIGHVN